MTKEQFEKAVEYKDMLRALEYKLEQLKEATHEGIEVIINKEISISLGSNQILDIKLSILRDIEYIEDKINKILNDI